MELKTHKITGVDDPYFPEMWKIYTDSFPLVEQRSHEDYALALEDEACELFVYLDEENKVHAILHGWNFPSSYFIEFYALAAAARGQGLGTKILEECKKNAQKKIILEIEEVCDEATEKRWRFYKRLGFLKSPKLYVHPPYQKDFSTFNLNILSFPNELDEEEYNNFVNVEKKISLIYSYYRGEIL